MDREFLLSTLIKLAKVFCYLGKVSTIRNILPSRNHDSDYQGTVVIRVFMSLLKLLTEVNMTRDTFARSYVNAFWSSQKRAERKHINDVLAQSLQLMHRPVVLQKRILFVFGCQLITIHLALNCMPK